MEPVNEHSEPTKELPSAMAPPLGEAVDEVKETANDDEVVTPATVQGEAESMENEPVPLQLTDEDKQIISAVEDIIKHKAKPKSKAKAKAKVADEPVKKTVKEPKAKQITLLLNQTLQIKLPDGEKTFKIEFI